MTLYNYRLLNHQLERLGLSAEQMAEKAGISTFSAYMALNGRMGTLKLLKSVSDVLLVKWEFITNIDLPESEFHRAVLTNGDRRGRSVERGPIHVGVDRPHRKALVVKRQGTLPRARAKSNSHQ